MRCTLIEIKYSCDALLISILQKFIQYFIRWEFEMTERDLMCADAIAEHSEKSIYCSCRRVLGLHTYADLGDRTKKHTRGTISICGAVKRCASCFLLETTKQKSKTQNNKFNSVSKFTVDASAAAACLQIDTLYITCTAMHEIMVQ